VTDPFDLDGTTALVIGAGAGGLGARAALALGRRGARVVAADVGARGGDLAAAGESLAAEGIAVTTAFCDVTDEHSVGALAATVGHADAVVNAAGVMLRKPVTETSPAEWRRVLEVNLTGTWLVNRAFGGAMAARGHGKIINFASVYADRVGPVPESAYYASKAGVANLTRAMASEFGARGVQVNCLALGVFYPTQMTAPLGDAPDTLAWMTDRTLLKRLGDPERDLDGPVVLLASAASDYITGQVIYVDGGWSAW
jgi:gluconate 5-dehydrogenase